MRQIDYAFPSWEGQGVGVRHGGSQRRLTHPLPLPRGECAVDLSNRLRKSCFEKICANLRQSVVLELRKTMLCQKIQ